ncbi:L-rhamnose mutarotase [Sphingomonas montana]|uniref:L-rhamnose mutarotase n=1 Tax=Sphingomonas montana TaxID=1843236 RepID=UPI00096E5217|nr:L-rhamnose mutarotase [Sphingomonas montana]
MTTHAFRMMLKPGQADEYRRRHDALWPDLAAALTDAGIHDYAIFLDPETNALFAVLKVHDDADRRATLPGLPVMQRWWDHMADIMEVEPSNRPCETPLIPMFHFA